MLAVATGTCHGVLVRGEDAVMSLEELLADGGVDGDLLPEHLHLLVRHHLGVPRSQKERNLEEEESWVPGSTKKRKEISPTGAVRPYTKKYNRTVYVSLHQGKHVKSDKIKRASTKGKSNDK